MRRYLLLLLYGLMMLGTASLIMFVVYSKVHSQVNVCRAYYPELSLWDCYIYAPSVLPRGGTK